LIGWQAAANGVDSESKELIEGGVKTSQAERSLAQQIPVECLYVPQVKDNPMTLRDGALIECFVAQNLKEFIRRCPCVYEPYVMIVVDAGCGGESSHSYPSRLMRPPIEGCTKISAQGGWLR
jgi:hypothetical protein